MKRFIDYIKGLFHKHTWPPIPPESVDAMGCFELLARCTKCGKEELIGGTLSPEHLARLRLERKEAWKRLADGT